MGGHSHPVRILAAIAGGATAGFLAGRLLPPLLAQARGRARAGRGGDALDVLARDHRIILSLLGRMEESSPDARIERTQLLARLKRRLGAHALAEEDVVYPLLHDTQVADVRSLNEDHLHIKMHLLTLENTATHDPQWQATVAALRALIAQHVRQEEEVEFPRLRDALDRAGLVRMSGQVLRERALLP